MVIASPVPSFDACWSLWVEVQVSKWQRDESNSHREWNDGTCWFQMRLLWRRFQKKYKFKCTDWWFWRTCECRCLPLRKGFLPSLFPCSSSILFRSLFLFLFCPLSGWHRGLVTGDHLIPHCPSPFYMFFWMKYLLNRIGKVLTKSGYFCTGMNRGTKMWDHFYPKIKGIWNLWKPWLSTDVVRHPFFPIRGKVMGNQKFLSV